jgi:hypothetical protein
VMAVPLAQPIAPGGTATIESNGRTPRAAHVRADRRDRQLLLHRAVVSRSSACCRTRAGTAISSTPARSSSPTSASTTCR